MERRPLYLDASEAVVERILDTLGKDIRLGLPLGLGKPVELVNALYRRAQSDPDIQLTVLTALSLERPRETEPMRKRLLEPVFDRVFEGCPELEYARDLSRGALPANVTVREFYFRAGSRLGNREAQSQYISSNYTHAARDVLVNGCNVIMQLLASRRSERGETVYSMSCNPDTSAELAEMLRESGRPYLVIGAVNPRLPYMYGDAEVGGEHFDIIHDNPDHYSPLFAMPKLLPVGTSDYLIGLRASALIRDGGTLQLGIGGMGDAIVQSLCLRHRDSERYRKALEAIGMPEDTGELVEEIGGTGPFDQGLYGATEMFVEGFMHLLKAGVLRRQVYDFWALQQLINNGGCNPQQLDMSVLEGMAELGVREIRTRDFDILQYHGFFNEETRYRQGRLIAPDGTEVPANMADPQTRRVVSDQCLGERLRKGWILHGGFFLGSGEFYQALRELDEETLRRINMTGVFKINQLDHNPRLYKAQRRDARFINTGMLATLGGAVASDTLESGEVISGVGGQYNFVAMAHQLPGGRSILLIRAVRERGGRPQSNIVWRYGSCTIPRHLRDIVITEYGVADLRSRSDGEVIKAMLNIADSRFQSELLQEAVAAGKVERDYRIPERYRNNLPERLAREFRLINAEGLFPPYPFGCDFTDDELLLARALKALGGRGGAERLLRMPAALARAGRGGEFEGLLERMGLDRPAGLRDRLVRALLLEELRELHPGR